MVTSAPAVGHALMLRCELAAQDRPLLSEFLELKKAPMTSAFVKGFG